jgi:CheY-like chemotaxis protein
MSSNRVLVVEDDTALREYLVAVLEQAGHSVVAAASGERALELVNENPAEVAVVDVGLPGMDGVEVADRLSGEVPVVFVTGDPVKAYAESYLRPRRYSVLPKPVSPEMLVHAVREAL